MAGTDWLIDFTLLHLQQMQLSAKPPNSGHREIRTLHCCAILVITILDQDVMYCADGDTWYSLCATRMRWSVGGEEFGINIVVIIINIIVLNWQMSNFRIQYHGPVPHPHPGTSAHSHNPTEAIPDP